MRETNYFHNVKIAPCLRRRHIFLRQLNILKLLRYTKKSVDNVETSDNFPLIMDSVCLLIQLSRLLNQVLHNFLWNQMAAHRFKNRSYGL